MVRWRPKEYWKPGTDVTVRSKLEGVSFGDGVWGDDDDLARFNIGAATVSTVDIGRHMMTVTQGGQVIRKIPITTGKSGWDTRELVRNLRELAGPDIIYSFPEPWLEWKFDWLTNQCRRYEYLSKQPGVFPWIEKKIRGKVLDIVRKTLKKT